MKKVLAMLALVAALAACAGATALEKGVFDYLKLKNWTDEAIEAACGVDGASFRPSNPQPLTCIVTCAPVIDPLTGAESEGGWERDHRIYPADTNRVLNNCSNLSGFSLTLTDDPNLATFRAYITFTYKKGGTFNIQGQGRKNPEVRRRGDGEAREPAHRRKRDDEPGLLVLLRGGRRSRQRAGRGDRQAVLRGAHRTAAAVSAAQEALGLPPDGVASAAFQAKLYGK